MKYKITLLTFFLLLSNFALSASQDKISCFVVNESYFKNESTLLKVPQITLNSDNLNAQQLYQNEKFQLLINSALTITPALKKPWLAAFNVIVKQENKQELTIRSSQRDEPKGEMHVHFSLRNSNDGTLTIECNNTSS